MDKNRAWSGREPTCTDMSSSPTDGGDITIALRLWWEQLQNFQPNSIIYKINAVIRYYLQVPAHIFCMHACVIVWARAFNWQVLLTLSINFEGHQWDCQTARCYIQENIIFDVSETQQSCVHAKHSLAYLRVPLYDRRTTSSNATCFVLVSTNKFIFRSWRWKHMFLRNVCCISTGLWGVISQHGTLQNRWVIASNPIQKC